MIQLGKVIGDAVSKALSLRTPVIQAIIELFALLCLVAFVVLLISRAPERFRMPAEAAGAMLAGLLFLAVFAALIKVIGKIIGG
jgi:hypothetical protein